MISANKCNYRLPEINPFSHTPNHFWGELEILRGLQMNGPSESRRSFESLFGTFRFPKLIFKTVHVTASNLFVPGTYLIFDFQWPVQAM